MVEVGNTDINCYGGCLTSAKVIVYGATSSAYCHDGSIMEHFTIFVSILGLVAIVATIYYKYYDAVVPKWCFNLFESRHRSR